MNANHKTIYCVMCIIYKSPVLRVCNAYIRNTIKQFFYMKYFILSIVAIFANLFMFYSFWNEVACKLINSLNPINMAQSAIFLIGLQAIRYTMVKIDIQREQLNSSSLTMMITNILFCAILVSSIYIAKFTGAI